MKNITFSYIIVFFLILLIRSEELIRKEYNILDNKSKLFEPFFTGYYNDKMDECNTSLPIQLSLILSEYPLKLSKVMSPMNMITCKTEKVAYSCDLKYKDFNSINEDLIAYIKYLNTNGSQYFDSFPYPISNKMVGKFTDCVNKNEIDSLINNQINAHNYDNYDIEKRNMEMKYDIYTKGSLLGLYNAPIKSFKRFKATYANKGIFSSQDKEEEYVALRIIGWKTIDDKEYWIFSYTGDESFGMFNYGFIDANAPIDFYRFEFS
jgi:hypothetical protein